MKNKVIDVIERLTSSTELSDRWKDAVALAEDLGLQSILIGKVGRTADQILWMNTSMPGSWIDEYISEGYAEADPFLRPAMRDGARRVVQAGVLERPDERAGKDYLLNHGLKSAGINWLSCKRYGGASPGGLYVTLCADENPEDVVSRNQLDLEIFSGLLAAGFSTPVENALQMSGPKVLSPRQREVLSLLAEGHQTARIAERLMLSEAVVSKHFLTARVKLGASTREQALAIAMQNGLLDL